MSTTLMMMRKSRMTNTTTRWVSGFILHRRNVWRALHWCLLWLDPFAMLITALALEKQYFSSLAALSLERKPRKGGYKQWSHSAAFRKQNLINFLQPSLLSTFKHNACTCWNGVLPFPRNSYLCFISAYHQLFILSSRKELPHCISWVKLL